jgi:chemotaxis protein histidine kinase CheA
VSREAEELAALRLSYARSLPDRLRQLREAVHAWAGAGGHDGGPSEGPPNPPGDAELYARAEAAAHRLRGTSGSYGFGAFSEKLGAVEDALRRFRAAGAPPPEAMAVIEPDLREADALAAQAIAGLEAGSA